MGCQGLNQGVGTCLCHGHPSQGECGENKNSAESEIQGSTSTYWIKRKQNVNMNVKYIKVVFIYCLFNQSDLYIHVSAEGSRGPSQVLKGRVCPASFTFLHVKKSLFHTPWNLCALLWWKMGGIQVEELSV